MTKEEILKQIKEANAAVQSNEIGLRYEINAETVNALIPIVEKAGELANIENIHNRVNTALQHEFGKAFGLINLLANIVYWPGGDNIAETRSLIVKELRLPVTELLDLREVRGYHSWYNQDEDEIYEGVQPNIEKVEMLSLRIATVLLPNTVPYLDMYISIEDWDKREIIKAKAAKKAKQQTHEALAAMKELED